MVSALTLEKEELIQGVVNRIITKFQVMISSYSDHIVIHKLFVEIFFFHDVGFEQGTNP
ncbi:hypothetical protein HanXRQr2_Chr03g0089531 [Helianthus annuus]|uniref:Uncharacterized protein n=1 Tax=Helianthus annuus TaxID=4232 RepID=A0A9K3NU41_HELAN|nr:hypothetical protein HanXRQr2_Chr03g0089531 [Helianthus annuus]